MPGTDIISCGTRPGTYIRKSGTSMAVPVVSGMIALLLCKYPAMMPNEVKLQLYRSADHSGIDESFKCWGTVDLQRLLSVYQIYEIVFGRFRCFYVTVNDLYQM